MDEKTFFQYDNVKVTSARFISGSQTYAMSNVTSVKAFKENPSRFWGIVTLLIGLAVASNNATVGLSIVVVAAFYLYQQKTVYHVILATAGGEASVLRTYQLEYLKKVVSALNEAIVYRG